MRIIDAENTVLVRGTLTNTFAIQAYIDAAHVCCLS